MVVLSVHVQPGMLFRGEVGGLDRHARQPRCAANAPATAVTHHTAIAAISSGAENEPSVEPSAVYANALGAEPMTAPTAICHTGTPNAPNA